MTTETSPKQFILSHRPVEYRQQGLTDCGLFAAEGVISAYEKNPEGKHPSEFHQSFWQRTFGLTPSSLIVSVLKEHGFKANSGNTKSMTNEERLLFLKKSLANDNPIIMHIGAGYWGDGVYKPILGKIIGHWISLWGYDDYQRVFYIYDSDVATGFYHNVPIGNVARSYRDVLRDWGQGVTPIPRCYEYVRVTNSSELNKIMPYQCAICKLEYANEETAKVCQEWCSTHDSCNFLIAKQALNKDQMKQAPAGDDERYHD